MDTRLLEAALSTKGFMPEDEGLALYAAAIAAPTGTMMEIGSYCGRSTVFLGTAAKERGCRLFTLDHHSGSEEHQPGGGYHDPDVLDPATGRINTLPHLLQTLRRTDLAPWVVVLSGRSHTIASLWTAPLSFLFIDGGHAAETTHGDFDGWSPHLALGGFLAIHDVFPDPAAGGRPPFEIYERALSSGNFEEVSTTGSLRVLARVR
jgi:predicted O-methyltransferase YrrM